MMEGSTSEATARKILVGDFNARHPYWNDKGSNRLGDVLFEYLEDKPLVVLNNTQPTRQEKIIDLTISSPYLTQQISNWKVDEEIYLNTDHNLISFEIGVKQPIEVIEKWDFEKTNWAEWIKVCNTELKLWEDSRRENININEDYETFVTVIQDCAEKIIPKKRICVHSKGFWSPKLTELVKKYKTAKNHFMRRRDQANEEKLLEIKQLFHKEVEVAKHNHMEALAKKLNPKSPNSFWKTVNNTRNNENKGMVQPILKEDGTLAITDEEILLEMKKRYGMEELDIKSLDLNWYNRIEEEVLKKEVQEQDKMKTNNYTEGEDCETENIDISFAEVENALKETVSNSAPSPEEQVFGIMLQHGGEAVIKCLRYIFQKCWKSGILPDGFKMDPKVMVPKPGKSNYNTTKSYRPITLESVVGKVMERIVKNRLTWKLEVEGGVSKYQFAYRKNKSCQQTVLRIVNSVQTAIKSDLVTIMVIMDYESCFERIWRAGLLQKASNFGIHGRLWMYLRNYLKDRQYYIKVNNEKSNIVKSSVGIPQGSVLSPTLCNLYTNDQMEGVMGKHAEYADDASLWNSESTIEAVTENTNRDLEKITKWCDRWNMKIAPEKTEVLVFSKDRETIDLSSSHIFLKNQEVTVSRSKKLLGVSIDDKLSFDQHIKEKTKAGFKALSSIDKFVTQYSGCSQSIYMKLYRSLVLPVIDYGAAVFPNASNEYNKCFGSIQRSAMIKASGCISSTSTEALEILTNCTPINLHMKLRQAQELIRIGEKRTSDPLKDEFNIWLTDDKNQKGKPTAFQLLMSVFNELRDNIELENIEKEFEYNRDHYGLSRSKEYVVTGEFKEDKDMQVENVKQVIDSCDDHAVLAFTDGSSLGNPGPTGAGAAVYLEGYFSSPILLKRGVSKNSNNYSGEIVGIEIALEFLAEVNMVENRVIHIFTDCQSAIISAFCKEVPTRKIESITNIKTYMGKIQERHNNVTIHWTPGHKNINGNELADRQAKLAATEMSNSEEEEEDTGILDAREAVKILKAKVIKKWNYTYKLSEKVEHIQEIFVKAGSRNCTGEEDRRTFSIMNQLLCGHSKLKSHWSKIDKNISENCDSCQVPETVDHFIFICPKYNLQRETLERTVEEVIFRHNIECTNISLATLAGEVYPSTDTAREELIKAFGQFIKDTGRFDLQQ